jgi:hypothetical protein
MLNPLLILSIAGIAYLSLSKKERQSILRFSEDLEDITDTGLPTKIGLTHT